MALHASVQRFTQSLRVTPRARTWPAARTPGAAMTTYSFTHGQHLGLYTAFHRSQLNRWLHFGTLGGVFFSAMVLSALVPFGPGLLEHGATLLMLLLAFTTLRLHPAASLVMLGIGLFFCALAGWVATQLPAVPLAAAAMSLHLISWWVSVKLCHEKVEPFVETPHGLVSSNVYFERSYFLGKNLGVNVTFFDAWIQFCISPLSTTWDLLELAGFSNPDQPEIDRVRAKVLESVRLGAPLFTEAELEDPRLTLQRS